MRIFQNSGVMQAYFPRLRKLTRDCETFAELQAVFLADRFAATHILRPVLDGDPNAFFTNGNDEALQRAWAREKGLADDIALEDILLAQIEDHRTEVFYNTDPVRFDTRFLRRMPGHVRHRFAWRAAPSGRADFSGYDLMLCNFDSILEGFRREGIGAAWFAPAHDPVMEEYATASPRPVDVAFIGTYSRHHRRRAEMIEAIARFQSRYQIALHLDGSSRFLRLAESPLGLIGPLHKHRRPAAVRHCCQSPVFGRELYQVLGRTQIVMNGAIDMSGEDRGNMRCWEALGVGALLLTDRGNYPDGMVDGETMVTYEGVEDAKAKLLTLLKDPERTERISRAGQMMVRERYSKAAQFRAFQRLIENS